MNIIIIQGILFALQLACLYAQLKTKNGVYCLLGVTLMAIIVCLNRKENK